MLKKLLLGGALALALMPAHAQSPGLALGGSVYGNPTASQAAPRYTQTPILGIPGSVLGQIGLAGNTSGTVTIRPAAAAGTYNFVLPTSAGTSGQPMLSGGGGTSPMTFGTLGPAAGGTGVANNSANTLTWVGNFPATFTLTGSTGVTFPTSGTLATQSQVATVINVTAAPYNAACNASTSGPLSAATDDTTAIQAAFTAAALTNTPVYFPAWCKITSAITQTAPFKVFGAGKAVSGLILGSTTQNGITIAGAVNDAFGYQAAFLHEQFGIVAPYTTLGQVYVYSGGSGYTNGTQTFTVLGGTCSVQPQFTAAVSGGALSAGVLAVSISTPGTCTVFPSTPASISGAGGSGAVVYLIGKSSQTAGSGILVDPSAAQANHFSIQDMRFGGLWKGVNVQKGGYCNISNSDFEGLLNIGVTLSNTVLPDTNSCFLDRLDFTAPFDPTINQRHILIDGVGSVHMSKMRFNGGHIGLLVNSTIGSSGAITFSDGFCENLSTVANTNPACITLLIGPSFSLGRIQITNSEFAPNGVTGGAGAFGINSGGCTAGVPNINSVTITGSTFTGGYIGAGTVTAASLDCISGLTISGNIIHNGAGNTLNGFSIGASSSEVRGSLPSLDGTILNPFVITPGATKVLFDDTAAGTGKGDTAYSMLSTDRYVYTTAALTAPRTWILPAASSLPAGMTITIIDAAGGVTSTNTLSVARNGSDTINGLAGTILLNNAGAWTTLKSDGISNWGVGVLGATLGGTGLAGGTSGGLPYFAATNRMASSGALTQFGPIYGGGAGAAPVAMAAGADGQIIVGQTTAAPLWRTMSGGCTLSAAGAITCTSLNGVSYPASLTSGGVLYASSTSAVASSALLGANLLMQGGGAGVAPNTFTLGGDCTFSTPNITCTKSGGTSFGTAAFQNYTATTWTPTLIGSSSGSWTLSTAVGSYEQIGRQFTVRFTLTASGSSSPLGNIQIGGLPAASANTANDNGVCNIVSQTGLTNSASYTMFSGFIGPGTQVIALLENGSGQAGQLAAVGRASSTPTLIGMCSYHN